MFDPGSDVCADFSGHAFQFLLHLYRKCVLVFNLRTTGYIKCIIF